MLLLVLTWYMFVGYVVVVVAVVVDLHGGSGTGCDALRSRCLVSPGYQLDLGF